MGCGGSTDDSEKRNSAQDTRSDPKANNRRRHSREISNHSITGTNSSNNGTGNHGHNHGRRNSNNSNEARERQLALDHLIAQLMVQDDIRQNQREAEQARRAEDEERNATRGLTEEEVANVGLLGVVSLKRKEVTESAYVPPACLNISGYGSGRSSLAGGSPRKSLCSGPASPVFSLNTSMEGCVMCFEPFQEGTDEVRLLPCGHLFHSQCIDDWLKRRRLCPSCNQDAMMDHPDLGVTAGNPEKDDSGCPTHLTSSAALGDQEKQDAEQPNETLEHVTQSTAYGGSKVWTVIPYGTTVEPIDNEDEAKVEGNEDEPRRPSSTDPTTAPSSEEVEVERDRPETGATTRPTTMTGVELSVVEDGDAPGLASMEGRLGVAAA